MWNEIKEKVEEFIFKFINKKNLSNVFFFSVFYLFVLATIYPFFNKMLERDVELYGYNDSTQGCYHYQSYLFGLKESAVYKLQNLYSNKKHLLTNYLAVVSNIELKLVDTFKSTDCFLKIGYIISHRGKNIFFNNDSFYKKLFESRVLPLIKLKRLLLLKT